jgi:predicted enzyme related to lactoylglutathione lyase
MKYEPGTFCWIELATPDRRAAQQFYTSLFGWSTKEIPISDDEVYVMLQKDDKTVAALYENKTAPPAWQSYVAVESADDAAKKARDLGATVRQEPFDVMDAGRMAVVQDLQGAVLALWQGNQTPGVEVRDEINTLCWNELMTTDVEASRKFYQSLFGWTLKISPGYTEAHVGEKAVGGLMQIAPEMEGMPAHWQPYFKVEDCDATLRQAQSLGTTEFFGPMDIEKVGRFAVLHDPHGATFALLQFTRTM